MTTASSGTQTFLFTDIEGSSRLWEREPSAMARVVAEHDAILADTIAAAGGSIFKMVGDACCAVFASPANAVSAAVNIQRAMAAHPWPLSRRLAVRVAIHTGPVVQRDNDYFGPTLNRVDRLLGSIRGDVIAMSATTADLVRHVLPAGGELVDAGNHYLKDLAQPERIFLLTVPDLPLTEQPLRTLDARLHNLPAPPAPLIGRDRELAELENLLLHGGARVLTLVGPGGFGKTRLALAVAWNLAEQLPDGAFFIDLSRVRDRELVMATVVTQLGLTPAPGISLSELLHTYLRDRRILLILDNLEQVIDVAGDLARLIEQAPQLQVLVTSRVPLRIRSERLFPLEPLAITSRAGRDGDDPPSAVAFFLERAHSAQPALSFSIDDMRAVAEICARLEGIPLAIELAATRTALLPPRAMLARLDRRLSLLRGGSRDLPDRHRAMRETIRWSYDLLDDEARALLRQLSVFAGGATLDAIDLVVPPAADDPLDTLETLLEHSLVRPASPGAKADVPRYTMLETIREYGIEQMSAEELASARERHAACFLALAERCEPLLMPGPAQQQALAELDDELDNLRAAMTWSLEHDGGLSALAIASAMRRYWWLRGAHLDEGLRWLERSLAIVGEPPQQLHARALFALADVQAERGSIEEAICLYEACARLYRQLGDIWNSGNVELSLGVLAWDSGNLAGARDHYERSALAFREAGDAAREAIVLSNLGSMAIADNDYAAATQAIEESLAIARARGDDEIAAIQLLNLGTIAIDLNDSTLAQTRFIEALQLNRMLRLFHVDASAVEGIAGILVERGEYETALELYAAANAAREATGIALQPNERSGYDARIDRLRQILGSERVDQAWSGTGQDNLSLDEAIARCLAPRDA